MVTIWAYKPDGTLQCGQGEEIGLSVTRRELESLIGKDNVLREQKRALGSVITLCGAPTGQVNAFEITEQGLWVLLHGFVGPMGFRVMFDDAARAAAGFAAAGEDPFPLMRMLLKPDPNDPASTGRAVATMARWLTEAGAQPTKLAEIIGRTCRVYHTGDPVTLDFRPDRVNIELAKGGTTIVSIWFG